MKKSLSITLAFIVSLLNSFADDEGNLVANFNLKNKASSSYQIKFISKTDPSDETIFEIPASSNIKLEIEKTKKEWDDIEIVLLTETGETKPLGLDGDMIFDAIEASGRSLKVNHDKGRKDDFDNSNKIAGNTDTKSTALSLPIKDEDIFIVKNKAEKIEYTMFTDNESSQTKEDGKIYKNITILIAAKEDQLTLALDNKHNKKITPYFYEITGNGIDSDNPVYLLGTCHTLSPSDYNEEIRNKIENTEILISEFPQFAIEMTQGQGSLAMMKVVYNKFLEQDFYWFRDQLMALNLSPYEVRHSILLMQKKSNELHDPAFFQSWFGQLSEAEKQMVETIATEIGVDLQSIHPAVLKDFIFLIGEASLEKEHIEDSLETHLIKLFSKDNKEIVYLDTVESLILAALNDEFLPNLQKDFDACIKDIKLSLSSWKQSSSDSKDCWKTDDFFRALDENQIISQPLEASVNARNIAWQNKVIDALNSGKSASIITGSAHLSGKTGFLKFLKSQGYNIKHGTIDQDTQNNIDDVLDFDKWLHNFNAGLEGDRLLEDGSHDNQNNELSKADL